MGFGFLFKGGEGLAKELVLIAEGLNLITKGSKGFNFHHNVME